MRSHTACSLFPSFLPSTRKQGTVWLAVQSSSLREHTFSILLHACLPYPFQSLVPSQPLNSRRTEQVVQKSQPSQLLGCYSAPWEFGLSLQSDRPILLSRARVILHHSESDYFTPKGSLIWPDSAFLSV